MRQKADNNGLSATQEKLIQALLQYPTIKAAATSVGIAERTARTYIALPEFQSAYQQAKQEMSAEIRDSLVGLAGKARDGLYQMMDDPECPPAVQFKAYQLVLDRAIPASDPQQPLQGSEGLIERTLLPYLTSEELTFIEGVVERAMERKVQAEAEQKSPQR